MWSCGCRSFINSSSFSLGYLQAVGKSKEDYVLQAQSKTKNAQKAAMQATFNYFRTQLETDQSTWEALQLRLASRKLSASLLLHV